MPSAWAGPGIRGRNQVIMSRAELVGIAFAPSPQIKDYVLTEALGSGTYATVYKAIQKVAIIRGRWMYMYNYKDR